MNARTGFWAIAALALLDFALTFKNVWPTLWIEPGRGLSVEVAVVVLILALVAERRGAPSRRLLALLAGAFVAAALARYAEVTAHALYGRPINLYYDAPHLPKVAAMFLQAAPAWLIAGALVAIVLGLGMIYGLMRWALGRVARIVAGPVPRRAVAAAAALAVTAYAVGQLSERSSLADAFATPVAETYVKQVRLLSQARAGTPAAVLAASPSFASDFARVGGADVFVVFVESYGATTFETRAYAAALASSRVALADALAATGRSAVSAFVEAPTFGGGSWLAHVSLLSGVEVREGDAYNLLMTQHRDTMVSAFARHGYRTLALMPGLREAWPEGAFYGFDDIYGAAQLDYAGPAFGWWRIPDQYALAKLDRVEVSVQPRRPLFVFFPTITSHAPFRPTPPYQPDWARLLTDRPYDEAATRRALAQPAEWTNLGPAYVDAVGYALRSLAGYLRERPGADLVLVVLGDHQPPAGVSGENASWNVPVHVIASRPALLAALVASGFTPGLVPHAPALGRTHQLLPLLLQAFGSAQPGVDVARSRLEGEPLQERPDRAGL